MKQPSHSSQTHVLRQIYSLCAVLCLVFVCSCGVIVRSIDEGTEKAVNVFKEGRRGRLSDEEQLWAKVAWKYFENNYNPQTGLVNAKDASQVVTMESIGDYIVALMAARELDVIGKHEFDRRLSLVFGFLNTMKLAFGELPNVNYHSVNMQALNYAAKPGVIGWQVHHIGRLMTVLRLLRNKYAYYGEYVDRVILRWSFCNCVDREGNLYSAVNVNEKAAKFLDAKHGLKEYTARSFKAWGFDMEATSTIDPVETIRINDIEIYFDGNDERASNSNNAVTSMPYFLTLLEFGWENIPYLSLDKRYYEQILNVYEVQKRRHEREDIFTARAKHEVSTEPFTVYDAVFSNGYKWTTISSSGVYFPQHSAVSTKAAFAMWAAFKTPYTDLLMLITSSLFDPARGWYEGRLEKTGDAVRTLTCQTNAIVLESLMFKKSGRLYEQAHEEDDLYRIYLRDEFKLLKKCFPLKKSN
ncbi:MAG: DUF3131 domain-containing protein [Candidatus Kapaibacterium sp.]|nr:MAG: DUF3131 domain-containing protein [Candidatus Kapabacteria bacterium]